MREPQTFFNHAKIVPAFHYFLLPVLFINLVGASYWVYATARHAWGSFSLFHTILNLLLAVALLILAFLARIFALGVQDRIIRLEERLRYEQLFPEDLKPRINEFTTNQLVALRFASDAELPALARQVLTDNVKERKAIKRMIQNWRADYQRV